MDSEIWREDGRWQWGVWLPDGSPTALAQGSARFRLIAIIGLRRALRRLRRAVAQPIGFLPVVRRGR